MDVSHPTWVQLVGYAASLLVLSTFYMKAMVPLRCVAIVSNVAFLTYGYFAGLYPVFFLHVVLLPLNILRLYQLRQLIERVRRASKGDYALEWMIPFMTKEAFRKADVLFRKGDKAAKFYYIESGSVRLPELGIALGPGEIIGEIGIFSPLKVRTATAICETDVTALVLSDYKVSELYYQMSHRR
jgi:CRP/FNR family transcriptional regulator, cyclic AMP receptor protein